jgi:2-phospho-L-lactate guanylyltransferase (CobY/MobA/RfbA family)
MTIVSVAGLDVDVDVDIADLTELVKHEDTQSTPTTVKKLKYPGPPRGW